MRGEFSTNFDLEKHDFKTDTILSQYLFLVKLPGFEE
jgi:hypothetical protein